MSQFWMASFFVVVAFASERSQGGDCDRMIKTSLPRGSVLAVGELLDSLKRLQCAPDADYLLSAAAGRGNTNGLFVSSYNKKVLVVADDHDHDDDDDALWHKIGALFVMMAIGVVGAGAPFVLKKIGVLEKCMPYLNSVACGAFIGLAFFHLLPEALYVTEAATIGIDVGDNWYNATFLMMFGGLSLIMVLEKIVVTGLAKDAHVDAVGQCHNIAHGAHGEPHHDHHHSAHDHHHELKDEESLNYPDASSKASSSIDGKNITISLSAIVACLSIAVHAVAEGMVVGMLDEPMLVWVATLSIVGHKWAEGFALAVNCLNKGLSVKSSLFYITIVLLASPIGIVIGILIGAHTTPGVVGILNGLCLGTILYTGFDLLFDEFGSSKKAFVEAIKFLCFLLGAGIVFGLMMVHLAGGSHDHH